MKGPQKRFIPHGSPEIGHLWNYNLRNDSNKALIQLIENETTFVLNNRGCERARTCLCGSDAIENHACAE